MRRALAGTAVALAVVTIAAAPASASTTTDDAKVVLGREAAVDTYPAQVALLRPEVLDNYQAQFCSGTLIDPQWVLTAAHCLQDARSPDVLLGTNRLDGSGTRIPTTTKLVHPSFGFPHNDVGLIRLELPVTTAATTPIAYEGMEVLESAGAAAIVSGWGAFDDAMTQFPISLQEADVPVVADEACVAAYQEYDLQMGDMSGLVCAGNGRRMASSDSPDACRGDSGGPLWTTGPDGVRRQLGIVSGGAVCGRSPSFYTSVEAFIPWIEQATGLQLASFSDIPGSSHEPNIERVGLAGFAGGIGNGQFGPGQAVTRGQMATFLAKALHLEPVASGPFTDTAGNPHEQNINAVAAAGIAGGRPDATFGPNDPVTRDQMATFLARALGLEPVDGTVFLDTAGNPHERNINAVARAGIAGGFGDGTYHPSEAVTRAQMATFLARAFL